MTFTLRIVLLLVVSLCMSQVAQAESLQSELNAKAAEFAEKTDEQKKQDFEQGVKEVSESEAMITALKVGDAAPDFTLVNAAGQEVNLKEKLNDGPVVVTWYRGVWCPYCNMALNAYQKIMPQLNELGATFIAISPQTPDNTLSTQEKNELTFEVVSDPGNGVAAAYGIAYRLPMVVQKQFEGRLDIPEYNGDDTWILPLTATYVIDRDGIITYAFVTPDYKERAEPGVILEEIEQLLN